MQSLRASLLLAIIGCCGAALACAAKTRPAGATPTYEALTADAERHLAQNEGEAAATEFAAAVALDAARPEAKYGYLLSADMRFANLIDQIIGTIGGLSLQDVDVNPPAAEDPIHEYFDEKLRGLLAQAQAHYGWLSTFSGAAITVESYAITVQKNNLLAFGGEFDEIDLRFFAALTSLIDGLFQFISAYDLRFDYAVLQFSPTGGDTWATIDEIASLLDALLSSKNFPTFLALQTTDGAACLKAAGVDFGDAFARLEDMFDRLQTARGRGAGQVAWEGAGHGECWNAATEPLVVGRSLTLSPAATVALMPLVDKLRRVFYQGSPKDVDPRKVDALTPADLTDLLIALGVLPLKIGSLTLTELPDWPAIDLGDFFSNPQPDQLRNILRIVAKLWEIIGPLIEPSAAEGPNA